MTRTIDAATAASASGLGAITLGASGQRMSTAGGGGRSVGYHPIRGL
jgi:hypothetical protein